MPMKSRRKGRSGEQELVRLLREHLGEKVCRNLAQSHEGGHDILGCGNFALESKRAAKPALNAWWTQTITQAEKRGLTPALAYRLDRQNWRFRVPLSVLMDGVTATNDALIQYTAELDLEGFCLVVREQID